MGISQQYFKGSPPRQGESIDLDYFCNEIATLGSDSSPFIITQEKERTMGIKNKLIAMYTRKPFRTFEDALRHPEKIESENWKRLLGFYRKGSFWNERAPKALASGKLQEFPLSEYEDYKACIDQSQKTGINPMTGEEVVFFADSAGTTSYPKVFPITDSFRKDYKETQAPFVHRLCQDFRHFLDKPALYLTATNSSKRAECGIEVGYISNFNYRNMPKVLASFYAIPKQVLQDEHTFRTWAPVYALAQEISAIFVITPFVLCEFFKQIERKKDFLLRALEGKEPIPAGFPPLRVSQSRLKSLRSAFSKETFSIQDLWKQLSFVCTWKASLAGLQVPELQAWIPDIPILDGTYSATEAWFNVPWFRDKLGGPLSHKSGIFEFLPVGKELAKRNLLHSWELKKNTDYEVFVTTSMGMIRYRLKDIVTCTDFVHRSPVIHFKYKAENLISLSTLRLSEDQLAQCLANLGIRDLAHVRIAPASDGARLLVAMGEGLGITQEAFENELQALSPYYGEERAAQHVGASQMIFLPKSHEIFQRVRHAQSKPSLISKVPFDAALGLS